VGSLGDSSVGTAQSASAVAIDDATALWVVPTTPPAPPALDAGAPMSPLSAADAGAPVDTCPYPNYPATEWSPEPWVDDTTTDPVALLANTRAILPGRWQGLASTPWTTPYRVAITLREDGHYSSRCTELPDGCCEAFYYGSDEDTPLKQYRIEDATLSGNVFGEIDITFKYDTELGLPTWQGELSHIRRDASGNGLRFLFQTSNGYGPIEYDLRRVPLD
jgi:hypothetical protein